MTDPVSLNDRASCSPAASSSSASRGPPCTCTHPRAKEVVFHQVSQPWERLFRLLQPDPGRGPHSWTRSTETASTPRSPGGGGRPVRSPGPARGPAGRAAGGGGNLTGKRRANKKARSPGRKRADQCLSSPYGLGGGSRFGGGLDAGGGLEGGDGRGGGGGGLIGLGGPENLSDDFLSGIG